MGSITASFLSEKNLHPRAQEIFLDAISRGWADPGKIHRASRELTRLLDESRQIFANHLKIAPNSIHFLGEPNLGFLLGIEGVRKYQSAASIYFPATARQEVMALVAGRNNSQSLTVDLSGAWDVPVGSLTDLLVHPTVNLETGAIAPSAEGFVGQIFVDATADPMVGLPSNWSTALWDAKCWAGPVGLGIFAIRDDSQWLNPLPHLDHRKVPGGYNPALVIAAAVALEATIADRINSEAETSRLSSLIRRFIVDEIGDVDIASPDDGVPHLLSFSFLYLDAEQLVDQMERRGFSLDSGSACISADLEPSHVLAAMGRLTHGNLRIDLSPDMTEETVVEMLTQLNAVVKELRAQ